MYNIDLNDPTDNDIKSMFAFLQQNPKIMDEYLKMQKNRKILNNNAPQINMPTKTVPPKNNNNSALFIDLDNNDCIKVNINFQTTGGTRHKVIAPKNIQMNDLFKHYVQKIGLDESVLDNDLFFISNANKININETKTIDEMGITDNHLILVMDSKNLVGA